MPLDIWLGTDDRRSGSEVWDREEGRAGGSLERPVGTSPFRLSFFPKHILGLCDYWKVLRLRNLSLIIREWKWKVRAVKDSLT